VYEYDGRGNCTRVRYFADGRPARSPSTGCAGVALAYDGEDRVTALVYLDEGGKPAPFREDTSDEGPAGGGHGKEAKITCTYNARGQVSTESFCDLGSRPAEDAWGVARYSYGFDDAGRVTELALFGPDGKPVRGRQGFARQTWKYDDQGRLEETASFGADGELMPVAAGEGRRPAPHPSPPPPPA